MWFHVSGAVHACPWMSDSVVNEWCDWFHVSGAVHACPCMSDSVVNDVILCEYCSACMFLHEWFNGEWCGSTCMHVPAWVIHHALSAPLLIIAYFVFQREARNFKRSTPFVLVINIMRHNSNSFLGRWGVGGGGYTLWQCSISPLQNRLFKFNQFKLPPLNFQLLIKKIIMWTKLRVAQNIMSYNYVHIIMEGGASFYLCGAIYSKSHEAIVDYNTVIHSLLHTLFHNSCR